ncbi:MAG: lipid-A-disaccharide synthase [Candidatus Cloacimonetes bacterium]|nr:lipid-A-disaccharide synthase [Candidatus Cloacimonadota bacterium]
MKQFRIFWLAGENSGDLHAAVVMRKLNQSVPYIQHYGIGGKRMQAEGLEPLFPYERFSLMGFAEVIKHLGFFYKVESRLKRSFSEDKPDLAILVDYPGLNLRVAKFADDARVPVLYFICPQFWAWKHKRVYKLKYNTRHVACILPFEKELLDIHNVTGSFVGHPIAEEIKLELDRDAFAAFYGLDARKRWVGFLPGSRMLEIERMLPVFLEASQGLDDGSLEFLFSKSQSIDHRRFMQIIHQSGAAKAHIIDGYNYELMKYSDFIVSTSGTATLETAYLGTPLLIAYKTSPISYRIARRLVRIKRVGLPNIVLEKDAVPELLQDAVTPANISRIVREYLTDRELYNAMKQDLAEIKSLLGGLSASAEMVRLIRLMLKIDE